MRDTNKEIRIAYVPALSWKIRLASFVGVFGGLWLFFEPLPALGVLPPLLPSNGFAAYVILLIGGGLLTLLGERFRQTRSLGKISFVSLTLVLTETGARVLVQAPKDIRVEKFLELLLKKLSKEAPHGTTLSNAHMCRHTLLLDRRGGYQSIDGRLTLREAGVVDNDVFQILGVIKPTFIVVGHSDLGGLMGTDKDPEQEMEKRREARINQAWGQFTSLSARLAETEQGRKVLKEYLHADRYDPKWTTLGLPDLDWKNECQQEWTKSGNPDPWDNPKLF